MVLKTLYLFPVTWPPIMIGQFMMQGWNPEPRAVACIYSKFRFSGLEAALLFTIVVPTDIYIYILMSYVSNTYYIIGERLQWWNEKKKQQGAKRQVDEKRREEWSSVKSADIT